MGHPYGRRRLHHWAKRPGTGTGAQQEPAAPRTAPVCFVRTVVRSWSHGEQQTVLARGRKTNRLHKMLLLANECLRLLHWRWIRPRRLTSRFPPCMLRKRPWHLASRPDGSFTGDWPLLGALKRPLTLSILTLIQIATLKGASSAELGHAQSLNAKCLKFALGPKLACKFQLV